MSWLGAHILPDDLQIHCAYPSLQGQCHRMAEKVTDWSNLTTSSSSSRIKHLSSADDPYTAQYGVSMLKDAQQPVLTAASSFDASLALQTRPRGLQQRSEFTIPYTTDIGIMAAQAGVTLDAYQDPASHLGQPPGIRAAMPFLDSIAHAGVVSAANPASGMSAEISPASPQAQCLAPLPAMTSAFGQQRRHPCRPELGQARLETSGQLLPPHLSPAGVVRAPIATQLASWQATRPTGRCSSDLGSAQGTHSGINSNDRGSVCWHHAQLQAGGISIPANHTASPHLVAISQTAQTTPHPYFSQGHPPQDCSLQGFSGQVSSHHGLTLQDQAYQDASVISQEAMDEATESHVAKQQFPVKTTTILRQWLRRHVLNPYADQMTKQQLAEKTGLSTEQVAAWLTNARRRLVPKVITLENSRRSAKGLPPLPPVQLKDKFPLGKQHSPGASAGERSP